MPPPIRLATIDIGTNSVLLLVVNRRPDDSFVIEVERCQITRLGEGIGRHRGLAQGAVERTLEVLRDYARTLDREPRAVRAAIGTAVLRDADNAHLFLEPAEEILGCPVEVVAGSREARLVLAGVRTTIEDLAGSSVIVDVGGGSTELIWCTDESVDHLVSLNLGAVRLTEQHLLSDPPRRVEVAALQQQVVEVLDDLPSSSPETDHLIGIAGTVTTLAQVALGIPEYDTSAINGSILSLETVSDQARQYARLSLAARKRIVGLDPARADVILAGTLLVKALMDRFSARALRVCDRGVRWGLMQELARR